MYRKESIEISDLYLAVFLKLKYGLRIISTDRRDGRVTFTFDLEGFDGQDLIRSYYNGKDEISASAFVKEIKELKTLVHNCE